MSVWGIGATLFFMGIGYFIGWQQGHDVGSAAKDPSPIYYVSPFPYQGVCGEILELAWSAQPDKTVLAGPNR